MITVYYDGKEEISIQESFDGSWKYAVIQKREGEYYPLESKLEGRQSSFIDDLAYAMYKSIGRVKVVGKECYWLKYDDCQSFIDMETGYVLKSINDNGNMTSHKYEFGTVTDEDVAKPDLTGAKIKDLR